MYDHVTYLINKFITNDVFYLPSFGPVYKGKEPISHLIKNVLLYWDNKNTLSYDKDYRWFSSKKEYIYVPEVLAVNNDLFVPVVNTLGKTSLKIFLYSDKPFHQEQFAIAREITKHIKEKKSVSHVRLFTFNRPPQHSGIHISNLYLKTLTGSDTVMNNHKDITNYHQLPNNIKATFGELAKEDDLVGSQMLWSQYINSDKDLSPILVAHNNNHIVGIIGPLDVINDPWQKHQLLAPFFEVKKDSRRKQYGKKLWKCAMDWAYRQGAEYMLIQAEDGEAADYFYQKHSLAYKGSIFSFAI